MPLGYGGGVTSFLKETAQKILRSGFEKIVVNLKLVAGAGIHQ